MSSNPERIFLLYHDHCPAGIACLTNIANTTQQHIADISNFRPTSCVSWHASEAAARLAAHHLMLRHPATRRCLILEQRKPLDVEEGTADAQVVLQVPPRSRDGRAPSPEPLDVAMHDDEANVVSAVPSASVKLANALLQTRDAPMAVILEDVVAGKVAEGSVRGVWVLEDALGALQLG